MSRKQRNKNNPDPNSQGTPPAAPTPASVSPRRLAVFVAVLLLVIVGGGFGIYYLTRGGGSGGPNPLVVIDTSLGPIKVELFQGDAPITVKNFLRYVDAKFYDGTLFHRVLPNFMIQGGGYEPGLRHKRDREFGKIRNESYNGLLNERGNLAMARTKEADSATSEFFINLKHNSFLDRENAEDKVGYAVFGRVIEGMGVVDKIATVKTADREGHEAVPVEDVVIKSVRRVEEK